MAGSSSAPTPVGGWSDTSQVDWYVDRIATLKPRQIGEQVLLEVTPPAPNRVLDLGCGDGRLAALILAARPSVVEVVAVDRSRPMLQRAHARFADEPKVSVRQWDLADPLTPLGRFDLIVAGFAIHHLEDTRKKQLFIETANQLNPNGVFINLEVVASATPQLHAKFLAAIGRTADDPEDRLASIGDQLAWMREAGLSNVDCLWRWRGFALLVGEAPAPRL